MHSSGYRKKGEIHCDLCFTYLAKDDMLSIKPGCRHGRDEELRSVCVLPECHRGRTRFCK